LITVLEKINMVVVRNNGIATSHVDELTDCPGRVADVHCPMLHALLMSSSAGERSDAFLYFAPAVTPTRSCKVARPKCTS